jgi:hypothetical protein
MLLRGVGGSRQTVVETFELGVANATVVEPFAIMAPFARATYVEPFAIVGYARAVVVEPFGIGGFSRARVVEPFSILDSTDGEFPEGGIVGPLLGWYDPEGD